MIIHLTIDRFEGKNKSIAVLLTDDGDQINFPRKLLPKGVNSGDILSFSIDTDAEATRQVAEHTRAVQDQLENSDPGGELKWEGFAGSGPVSGFRYEPRVIVLGHGQTEGFAGSGPVSGFRYEPRVIVLGHGQTVAARIPRRDPSRDVPWQPRAIHLQGRA
jgi:hypothetical protein